MFRRLYRLWVVWRYLAQARTMGDLLSYRTQGISTEPIQDMLPRFRRAEQRMIQQGLHPLSIKELIKFGGYGKNPYITLERDSGPPRGYADDIAKLIHEKVYVEIYDWTRKGLMNRRYGYWDHTGKFVEAPEVDPQEDQG